MLFKYLTSLPLQWGMADPGRGTRYSPVRDRQIGRKLGARLRLKRAGHRRVARIHHRK